MKSCDIREATHVKVNGKIQKISSTWGISKQGKLAKPSDGGFGVVTEKGTEVSMWDAQGYYRPPFIE